MYFNVSGSSINENEKQQRSEAGTGEGGKAEITGLQASLAVGDQLAGYRQ